MGNLSDSRLDPNRIPHIPEHDRPRLDTIETMEVGHYLGGIDDAPHDGLALMYDTGAHQERTPDWEGWQQRHGTLIVGTYLGCVITDRWLPTRERRDPTRRDRMGHPGALVEDPERSDDPDTVGTAMAQRLPTLARRAVIASMNREAVSLRRLIDDDDAGEPIAAHDLMHYTDPPPRSKRHARQLVENALERHCTVLNSLT